jgi:hypothetical protein
VLVCRKCRAGRAAVREDGGRPAQGAAARGGGGKGRKAAVGIVEVGCLKCAQDSVTGSIRRAGALAGCGRVSDEEWGRGWGCRGRVGETARGPTPVMSSGVRAKSRSSSRPTRLSRFSTALELLLDKRVGGNRQSV